MSSASETGWIERRKSICMYICFYGETLTFYPFTFIILKIFIDFNTKKMEKIIARNRKSLKEPVKNND